MAGKKTRRELLQQTALAGVGYWVATRPAFAQSKSPNEKLHIGVIGVSGQGGGDMNQVADQAIVALCDAHESRAGEARQKFSKAKFYADFRKMLDQKGIDAVMVGTPDHIHAPATVAALRSGRHVFCEKPLTHSVYEARRVIETARETGKVTQMGTQIHARGNYRRVVEALRTGVLGPVREVHVWVGRGWNAGNRPAESLPVPEGLHYDLWIGPAPFRDYHAKLLPGEWRRWWDFGGGTLGDMGCHYMDLPHWALHLTAPVTVEAEGPEVNPDGCPSWLVVRYQHPARGTLPPVKLTWYHGRKRPPHFAAGKLPKWGDGVLFVGDKGMMLADYNRYVLLPEKNFEGYKPPTPFIPDSIGHYREWVEACKGRGRTLCHFGYSGPLTETVLLGNVAFRTGKKLEWDAANLRATNAPEADKFLRRDYRAGWTL